MIGKTISHYKIISKLGEGGMGVVYKAKDTKLDREVALKFLPASQLGTGDDQQRFEQEAKAAAKLSHANIATVFEINEHEGATFIAMEYVDGETLSDMVEKRPLKIQDAIKIAKQIAEGLHSAHEQGIVHRDIKSANIMITAKGVVKIMDFGLAKVSKGSMVTKAGTTLGTISYMSPEQTQGEKVDHRSDIWSLGVVLYEMVSGQMPFKGDYESAIIYSIMNEEPEPLTAVRSRVPMKLEEIVNKLLAKEPSERYQNIVELPVDLKNVSVPDATTSKIGSSAISDTISQKKKMTVEVEYSYKTILKIAALVIPSFALAWVLKPEPPPPEPRPANKIVVPLQEDLSFNLRYHSDRMAISPDGSKMVFMTDGDEARTQFLYTKKAGSFETEELAGTDGAQSPFFSPDGRWIGYFDRYTDEIRKISVDGGEPLMITKSSRRGFSGATWAPDNTIIFSDIGGLRRVSEAGGEATSLTKSAENEHHALPHMLPNGQTVLFTIQKRDVELNDFRLAAYTFGDDDYQVILEGGYNGIYSPTGHILYGRSNRLMGVPFDLKNLRTSGVPIPVLDNVQTHTSWGGMSYALSREGTIIYVPGTAVDDDVRSVLKVDLLGQPSEIIQMRKRFLYARYSPDGNYVAFSIQENTNDANIWIYHVKGEATRQLTFYKSADPFQFAWSPDSKTIAYATPAEDSTNSIYMRNVDGTGTARKIYTSPLAFPMHLKSWSRNEDEISFTRRGESSGWDLFVYSFQDSSVTPFLATPTFESNPYFSPNGNWMLFQAGPGRPEVYVRPYPESSGGLWKISESGGEQHVWSPDGKRIYYLNDNAMYAVDVTTQTEFSKGIPRKIFEGNYVSGRARRFDIHPNGESFIMISQPEAMALERKIFVILNFDEELKRLVPVERN